MKNIIRQDNRVTRINRNRSILILLRTIDDLKKTKQKLQERSKKYRLKYEREKIKRIIINKKLIENKDKNRRLIDNINDKKQR